MFRHFYDQHKFMTRFPILIVILLLLIPASGQVVADSDTPADPLNDFIGSDLPDSFTITSRSMDDNLQSIDNHRIETFSISMPQLDGREKDIIVFFPSDYSISKNNYPVVYLQNAEEVFIYNGYENDYWLLNESLYQFYTNDLGSEAIIVGIKSEPIFFWEEYGPWVNKNMYLWMDPYEANRVEGGEGEAYLSFLSETLKPFIDNRYRTLLDRDNTFIGGYDMGGLISLYAGLTNYDTYSKIMALSPTVWFAEESGSWLSHNRLLELIDMINLPQDVSFIIDVDDQQRTTDIDVRPAVYDSQGIKISFPQAYLEGAQKIIESLIENGVPSKQINNGNRNYESWWDDLPESSIIERSSDFSYYFPLVTRHGLDYFNIYIPFENRTRRIWVYLPPDYYKTNIDYQVIYLTDAQHIFGSETGAHIADGFDWQFDEKLDELYEETGKGTIAIGIEFDATHPWDEYMPWDNNNMDNWLNVTYPNDVIEGKGDEFLDFIIYKLKPEIISRYRTLDDREYTAIGGGSRCALFAFYAGLVHPDIFSKVMAMSPAVWLAENGARTPNIVYYPYWLTRNKLMAWLGNNNVPKNVRYYLYIGEKEVSGPPEPYPFVKLSSGTKLTMPEVYLRGAYKLQKEMLTNLGSSTTFKYIQNPDGTHRPSYWRQYVPSALDWLGLY